MKLFLTILGLSVSAFAHTSVLEHGGFMQGFAHPISGLDHILAMVGVGMIAYLSGKKALFSIASFMGAMILAAVVGFYGLMSIPVEEGILLSVAVIFALIGLSSKLSLNVVLSIVAFFGFFHGFAHGAEFAGGEFSLYILGFSASTLILHLSGMALAYTFSRYYKLSQTPAIEKI